MAGFAAKRFEVGDVFQCLRRLDVAR